MSEINHVETVRSTNTDSSKLTPLRTPYRLYITAFDEIHAHQYRGEGTLTHPHIVDWLPHDPENPQTWNRIYKCFLGIFAAITALAVTFCSSAYLGEVSSLMEDYQSSREITILGISLFVLGLALGKFLRSYLLSESLICRRSPSLGFRLWSVRPSHHLHPHIHSTDHF